MRDRQAFERADLPNGITVYTYRDAFPICCMELQLPVGIAHCVPANGFLPGSAHFLEHVQLIRSARFPEPYSSDRALGLRGGNSNAATQLKLTTHWIDTPMGEQAFGAGLLLDRTFAPLFDEADLAVERGVIANERDQNKFYPGKSKASQYYFREFLDDAYCPVEQVFGSDADLAGLDAARVRDMHAKVTGSRGIVALAVGDDDFTSLKERLAALPTAETAFASGIRPTGWTRKDYHEAYFDSVAQPRLEVAWVHGRPSYEDYRAACFTVTLLINSTQGPLYREFREEKGWTYGLEGVCALREGNLVLGLTVPLNGMDQVRYVRDCLHERIAAALRDQDLVEDEIRRQTAIQVYAYQSAGSIVSAASGSLAAHGAIKTQAQQRDALEAMRDPAFRERILATYFGQEDMGSMCFLPERRAGR